MLSAKAPLLPAALPVRKRGHLPPCFLWGCQPPHGFTSAAHSVFAIAAPSGGAAPLLYPVSANRNNRLEPAGDLETASFPAELPSAAILAVAACRRFCLSARSFPAAPGSGPME